MKYDFNLKNVKYDLEFKDYVHIVLFIIFIYLLVYGVYNLAFDVITCDVVEENTYFNETYEYEMTMNELKHVKGSNITGIVKQNFLIPEQVKIKRCNIQW